MRNKIILAAGIFLMCVELTGCGYMGLAASGGKTSAKEDSSETPAYSDEERNAPESGISFRPDTDTQPDSECRTVETIRHSENYQLQRESGGTYILKNRTTGKLLSLTVSEPRMPDQTEEFLAAVRQVYETAHDEGYAYGDSRTSSPCEDHLISCDRMIARALWNLGYTDQRVGGMTIGNEDSYLLSHGFRKLMNDESCQRGDIVLYERTENGAVSHTCVLTGYNKATGICSRYDCGGTTEHPRFTRIEPIVDPIVYQYDYAKRIRAVYRMQHISGGYDSSLELKDLDDREEQSQRWIAEQTDQSGYILHSAINEQYVVRLPS